MSKVWSMMMMVFGTTLLLQLAGMGLITGILSFIGLDFNNSGMTFNTATLITKIVILLGASAAAGAAIGFFTGATFEWMILAPFAAGTLSIFVSVFASLINKANEFDSWIYTVVFVVYGMMAFGFIWAFLEWVFNRQ